MAIADTGLNAWARDESAGDLLSSLLQRCFQGDERAFTMLYDQYAAYVYRLAFGFLQHREDAEEVLQDTFEYAFRRIHKYDPDKAGFKTWLYQIAASRCRNKRRRKWLPTFSFGQLDEGKLRDASAPLPDDQLVLSARQMEIWKALRALSPKLRETAVLRYYEGLSYPEIGQILGIPAKTAESRMRLAHGALKDMLSPELSGED